MGGWLFALIPEELIIQQANHKMGLVEKGEIIYTIQVMAYRKTPFQLATEVLHLNLKPL